MFEVGQRVAVKSLICYTSGLPPEHRKGVVIKEEILPNGRQNVLVCHPSWNQNFGWMDNELEEDANYVEG